MSKVVQTYCRNCPSICGLKMEVEDNRIKTIRGDREHPLTDGYICIKGQSSGDWQNGEDRLTGHLVKRPDGSFAKIEFEQALDEIWQKLSAIIDEHGVDSVATYYGTGVNNNALGHSAMKGWVDALGSPFVFSSMSIDQSAKWITVGRMGAFLTGKYNVLDGDVIMIIGNNPLVSHSGTGTPMTNPKAWLKKGLKDGAKLIVVDPRRTETAKRADIHVAIDPGEDAFFFAGLINIILKNGWHDQNFCDQFITGLDELRAAVAKFTPDVVAKRAGVNEEQLMLVAETFAKAEKKSAHTSTGPNMCPNSNVAEHMIEAMNAICGGYRRAGDELTNLQVLRGTAIAQEMVMPPNRMWETTPQCKSAPTGQMFGEYPTPLLPHEIVNDGDQKIRALICIGGNPIKAIPDVEFTTAAFEELDLLVTIDPRMSETCEASDYVIGTSLPYERHDFTGMYDSFLAFTYANAVEPVVDRPGDVVDDWEFFYGLTKRMGKQFEMKMNLFGATHEQTPGPVLELDMNEKPSSQDLVRWMCSQNAANYDDLIAAPQGILFEDMTATIQPADSDCPKLEILAPDVAAELDTVFAKPKFDGKYRITVRRMMESMNSAFSQASKTLERFRVNPAFMNPGDMAAEGLVDGQKVKISSVYGSITGYSQSDDGLKPGVVSMTHCWGKLDPADDPESQSGSNIAALFSLTEQLEPINYMPTMTALPVEIAKA